MTQEEKQLLLKDLCARLPYEVKGFHRGEVQRLLIMDSFGSYQVNGYDAWFNLDTVSFKPYLRPMSSMIEEEKSSFHNYKYWILKGDVEHCTINMLDWLNSHYFDYRGLIEKSLVIVAPDDMYKIQ